MSLQDRLTAHLKHIVQRASAFAEATQSSAVSPSHLLLAVTLERGSLGSEILSKVHVQSSALKTKLGIVQDPNVEDRSDEIPRVTSLDANAQRTLEKAALAAATHGHPYIGSEHLLVGLVESSDDQLLSILTELHIDPTVIASHLTNVLKSTSKFPEFTSTVADPHDLIAEAELESAGENPEEPKTPALDFFAKDLTDASTIMNIDPVIGRTDEIDRLVQILCRRTKNNPILVGEPGVGKTAIVEGLARKIVERDVPDILVGKRILALDLALVVAGTIYRGEFESRLKQILDEVRLDTDLVLFIDEIHTIMGAGAASGSMDAANILKPALARGEIRCIGATTYDEYKKHVENDAALERRFQQVHVSEPTPEATKLILDGLKPYYEQFHRVKIADSAIEAAVQYADQYLADRHFPDKAIDLIDEAAARLRVQVKNDPLIRRASTIEAKLEVSDEEKRSAVVEDRFDDAAAIQRSTKRLTRELAGIKEQLKDRRVENVGEITSRDVAAVIAQIMRLPVEEILLEEHERFRRIGEELTARIVGQTKAVTAISAALQRAKSGLAAPDRPLASFLLLGPSGVGKTETARALAQLLFQSDDALIRLDMSEFSEGFTISKLIGAPAGYVGYREGSKLTDTIRKRPASIVLFDEIEKAHPDVWNLLLQILEDGRLTDASGRESRFTNAIIILTSNVGASAFASANIGFSESEKVERVSREEDIQADALAALRQHFRPELLNRIDETIIYRPLGTPDLATIAKMDFEVFSERLKREQGILVIADDEAFTWLAARAYDPMQGARAIRRLLHEHVENPIAQGIIEERYTSGDRLKVAASKAKDGLVLEQPSRAHARPAKRREVA
jgi:ATP-dependent Clp protease ATP-binding subunit ClpC